MGTMGTMGTGFGFEFNLGLNVNSLDNLGPVLDNLGPVLGAISGTVGTTEPA